MSILPHLYRHNRWANVRLVDFCLPLSMEQLTTGAPASHEFGAYGSLVHLLLNEEYYYEAITGEKLNVPAFDMERIPSLSDVRKRMEAMGERWVRLAGELPEDRILEGERDGERYSMPAYIPLLQCINHSTEHREQAKAGLTLAGLEPPAVDFWSWEAAGRP